MFFGMASLATSRMGALEVISVLPSRPVTGRIVHVHGAVVARISLGLVPGLSLFFHLKLVHFFNMHAFKKIVQIRRIVRFNRPNPVILLFEAAVVRRKTMKKSGCKHVVSHIIFDCLQISFDLADLIGVVGHG